MKRGFYRVLYIPSAEDLTKTADPIGAIFQAASAQFPGAVAKDVHNPSTKAMDFAVEKDDEIVSSVSESQILGQDPDRAIRIRFHHSRETDRRKAMAGGEHPRYPRSRRQGGAMSLDELREAAIIATLIDRIAAAGKFCGETLIQKSVFFLEELFRVPMSAKYRLYYYGPFSFDLRDQLQGMQADDFVKVKPHEYGATYVAGQRYVLLQRQFPQTIAKHEQAIDFAVRELAKLSVGKLEPLATALYLTRERPTASVDDRARELHAVKPHIDMQVASQSVRQIDAWLEQYSVN